MDHYPFLGSTACMHVPALADSHVVYIEYRHVVLSCVSAVVFSRSFQYM